LPGGQIGFLILVNVLIFFLAFFLDFFELSFIVVPLLAPVADKLGIDLIWFGVLLAVNMQTSFMHPPFGFALFYLRSVAPAVAYTDRITKKLIQPVTTMQIYWGAVPFVLIQVIMVGLIIFFPGIVSSGLDKKEVYDLDKIRIQMESQMHNLDGLDAAAPPPAPGEPPVSQPDVQEDPLKAAQEAIQGEKK
jgi:GntP family gluconate:H+ symporter